MKPIKVFWNGEPLRNIYPHASRWQVFKFKVRMFVRWLFKWTIVSSVVIGMFSGVFILGGKLNPDITYATLEVEVEAGAPVLERIAKCESNNSHFDKNGQVLINKTQDVGRYQINVPIWGKKATELKLDLSKEGDNEKFARWLYKNHGTEPWIHSKTCWK